MIPIQDPLSVLNYGQIHVIELGVAIGLLAATFYRSDRYASYTILGLSVGIIVLQRILQVVPDVTQTTFRIASMPFLFTVPMIIAFALGIGLLRLVRSSITFSESAQLDEQPAD